jgi:hypothetical protein
VSLLRPVQYICPFNNQSQPDGGHHHSLGFHLPLLPPLPLLPLPPILPMPTKAYQTLTCNIWLHLFFPNGLFAEQHLPEVIGLAYLARAVRCECKMFMKFTTD